MTACVSRGVYLHIGAPKTGTTYLQDRLTLNAATLRRARRATTPPGRRWSTPRSSTSAPPSTCSARTGAARPATPRAPGTPWSSGVRRRRGTVIISHEILAPARPGEIARAMHDLAGSEVHVVYSARDLGRQLPAAWQESIKQGRKWTFRAFLDRVERGSAVVLPRLRPAQRCSTTGAPDCRPSASTS